MYSGRTAGTLNIQSGGGANYLCLPDNPEYLATQAGTSNHRAYLYGTEYESPIGSLNGLHNHNVPCAICYASNRVSLLMIPAKLTCPTNRTMEYQGYLMAEYHVHKHNSVFVCVDKNKELLLEELRTQMVLYSSQLKQNVLDYSVPLMMNRKS